MSRRDQYDHHRPSNTGTQNSSYNSNNQRWDKGSWEDEHNYDKASHHYRQTSHQYSRERNRQYTSTPSPMPPPPSSRDQQPQAVFGSRAEEMLRRQHEEEEKKRLLEQQKKEAEADALMTEDEKIAKILGFSSFQSTKGKYVKGANPFLVDFIKQKRFSQYKNRRCGGQMIPAKKI